MSFDCTMLFSSVDLDISPNIHWKNVDRAAEHKNAFSTD